MGLLIKNKLNNFQPKQFYTKDIFCKPTLAFRHTYWL